MPAVRATLKSTARPLLAPLVRRFQLVYARIEELRSEIQQQQRIESEDRSRLFSDIQRQTHELRSQLTALRGSNENLTRAWLAQEAELRLQRSAQETLHHAQETLDLDTTAVRQQISEAAQHGAQLERETREVERQLSELRNEYSGSSTRVDDTLRFLLQRVEFVRREVLFEMQQGAANGSAEGQVIAPRIIDAERVGRLSANGLRLNIGCGHIALPDYVNVDARELPGVDVVADAGAIGFEPASAVEIFSSHLLEHFPLETLRRRILPHWNALLARRGTLRAVVPDGDAMIRRCASGDYSFADFREALFGAQDYRGDYHFNLFTPESLSDILAEAGYVDVEVLVRGRRNGQCYEFEVSATKP